mgnify:CR=1 FL=1
MIDNKIITVTRDCDAILVPVGDKVKLLKGTKVRITQSLGGDYTLSVGGNLVKVSGIDSDAIGIDNSSTKNHDFGDIKIASEDMIWDQLKTCYDPEIPVNIVDLGLIYKLKIESNDTESIRVIIDMTLTAPGCGMGPAIAGDADTKVRSLPGVSDVTVNVVWEPVWDQSMMTEEAKLQLGML